MSNLYQQVGMFMLAAAKVYPPGEVVPPLLGVGRDRAAGRLIPLPFPRSQPAPKWPTLSNGKWSTSASQPALA